MWQKMSECDKFNIFLHPIRLSDFDEMFQRAASNRQRRSKPNLEPEDLLDMDPPLGKPGEQYYLDLAGNIRKVFVCLSKTGFLKLGVATLLRVAKFQKESPIFKIKNISCVFSQTSQKQAKN